MEEVLLSEFSERRSGLDDVTARDEPEAADLAVPTERSGYARLLFASVFLRPSTNCSGAEDNDGIP